jgi:2-octaprenyl-6-methoxyphenol hydroxylase
VADRAGALGRTEPHRGDERHDAVVIGGGPVGAAFAIALRGHGLSVLVLDAGAGGSGDRRSIALSFGSRLILERLDAWTRLAAVTPIESIHVSQRGGFGRAVLHARDAGLPALGYVVGYASLLQALAATARSCPDVSLRHDTQVLEVQAVDGFARVCCRTGGQEWAAQGTLAVVADGGSAARAAAPLEERDYRQCAIVADVVADRPHAGRAFERFTPSGPIALLPAGEAYALVWTTTREHAQDLSALADLQFLAALQDAFGGRAGRFQRCTARASYPLSLRVAGRPNQARVVLLGNAAQTLHPVAGQGLNLGLRDAWALAQLCAQDRAEIGSAAFLARFRRQRATDRRGTIALTDLLVTGFSNHLAPLCWLRGFGLTFLDALPPAKQAFIERMTFGG